MSPIPFCPSQVFQLFPLSSLTCSEAQRATELFPIFCYSRSYSVRSFSFFPACAMSPGHVASAFLVFLSHDMNIHVPCCFFFFIIACTILLFYSWYFKWLTNEVSCCLVIRPWNTLSLAFLKCCWSSRLEWHFFSSFLCAFGFLLFFFKSPQRSLHISTNLKKGFKFPFYGNFLRK